MLHIIAFAAALAWDVYGWSRDYDESKRKLYYGKSEGNEIYRNDQGQMNAARVKLVLLTINIGVGLVLIFAIPPLAGESQEGDHVGFWAAACWYAAFGLLHFLISQKNVKNSKNRRVAQIAYRARLKTYITRPDELRIPGELRRNVKTGLWYHPMLAWLRAPGATVDEAWPNLRTVLLEWAALPETNLKAIWHDLEYHPE